MGLNLKAPRGAPNAAKAGEEAAATLLGTAARVLMCAPTHYRVDYTINPWMENQIGKADNALAIRQWTNLARLLAREAELAFVAPAPGLPDMVFAANAGLAIGGTAVVSHFATKEREPEERPFRAWFEAEGFEIAPWPWDIAFEGAGDALLDNSRSLIWCGHGWRSSAAAVALLETIFARRVVGLRLVDPRFYHLDTCFCPLSNGEVMYYPAAFDAESQERIERQYPAAKRICVSAWDALRFACNAINIGKAILVNQISNELYARLQSLGYSVTQVELTEFLKAGGAAKCLALRLSEMNVTHR